MSIKSIIFSLSLLFAFSCQVSKNINPSFSKTTTVEKVPYRIANNYFVKSSLNFPEITTLKISTEDEFEKYFGKAYYMGNNGTPTKIDFGQEFVLAVIHPETDLETNIEINKIEKIDKNLKFYYTVKQRNKNTYTTKPVLIAVIKDFYQVKVDFIKE